MIPDINPVLLSGGRETEFFSFQFSGLFNESEVVDGYLKLK